MTKISAEVKNIAGIDFEAKEWDALVENDPSIRLMASSWQDPGGNAASTIGTDLFNLAGMGAAEEIPSEIGRVDLQQKCWETYRTFGPIRATIDSKSDYTAGAGFSVASKNTDINEFLHDLYASRRNKLYSAIPSWITRMQAQGELFLLISFDGNADATVRVVEPGTIVGGDKGYGVITHPDDVTTKLFYIRKSKDGEELIPDINLLYEPSLINAAVPAINKRKIGSLTKTKSRAFRKFGGFRRFIIHWSNLTGETKFVRDSSSLLSVLEAKNLYWNTIKWQVDHKKAQTAYTVEVGFEDSPAGRVAWNVWKRMKDTERDATGLTKTLTPGSRVFTMPGMKIKIHAPQLTKLQGENADLLNVMGAGIKTPQDMIQGNSAGSTYASLRMSRPPLLIEIKNLQLRLKLHLDELNEACLYAKSAFGGLLESYPVKVVDKVSKGVPTFRTVERKPHTLVIFSFPAIVLDNQPDNTANAWMGSAHTGVAALGVSRKRVAHAMGVDNLDMERRAKWLEEEEYGEEGGLSLNPAERQRDSADSQNNAKETQGV